MKRVELQLAEEHKRVRGPCIEGDWRRLEQLLQDGVEPSQAARSFGRTLGDFKKSDYFRHQKLLALSREARADVADRDLHEWAHAPDASDTIRVYWHRYTANAAGRGIERHELDVSVSSAQLEDRSASLADVATVLRESGALRAIDSGNDVGEQVAEPGEVVAAPALGEREAGGLSQP